MNLVLDENGALLFSRTVLASPGNESYSFRACCSMRENEWEESESRVEMPRLQQGLSTEARRTWW